MLDDIVKLTIFSLNFLQGLQLRKKRPCQWLTKRRNWLSEVSWHKWNLCSVSKEWVIWIDLIVMKHVHVHITDSRYKWFWDWNSANFHLNIFDKWELPKGIQENYLLRRSYDNRSEYFKITTPGFFYKRENLWFTILLVQFIQ